MICICFSSTFLLQKCSQNFSIFLSQANGWHGNLQLTKHKAAKDPSLTVISGSLTSLRILCLGKHKRKREGIDFLKVRIIKLCRLAGFSSPWRTLEEDKISELILLCTCMDEVKPRHTGFQPYQYIHVWQAEIYRGPSRFLFSGYIIQH